MKIVQEFFYKGEINRIEQFISTEEYQHISISKIIEETETIAKNLAWAVTILDNGNKEVFYKTNNSSDIK
ncbi:MAG: hypothetical protein [Bacteriophage sp.]|nr:MAG: hypothetical protein [Bacteriophage sp.]